MAQYFKGDELELKFYNSGLPANQLVGVQLDAFYNQAFECFVLGELLYDNRLSPLANAIPREVFRTAFATIFEAFISAGSLESYMIVFRQIFGDDVEITFTIPNPGHLQIDIVATGIELSDFITRYIEDNVYVYDEIVDDEGDNIVFQGVKGLESEYEVNQMLREMVPAGIYTEISLTIGE